jgi:hypothetical protein
MKKTFGIIVTLTLVATLGIVSAAEAATVRAGAACNRVGITKTVSSTKFTCIKSGTKLVWNRGVKLPANDSVAASPVATPMPSHSANIQKLNYASLDNPAVLKNVRLTVAQEIAKAKLSEAKISLSLGPSLSADKVKPNLASIQTVLSVFSQIYTPDVFYVNLFAKEDADWVDQAIISAGGNANATPNGVSYSAWMKSVANCNMGNASIGAKGPYFNQCLSPDSPASGALETSAHETFHTVQQAVGGYDYPVWFSEGGATFIGTHFGPYGTSDYPGNRDSTLSRYLSRDTDLEFRNALASGNQQLIVSRFRALEGRNADSSIRTSAYVLGWLASEVLVAVDGWDKWIALHTGLKSKSFSSNFKDVYGMTLDEFYPIAAKYVISQK